MLGPFSIENICHDRIIGHHHAVVGIERLHGKDTSGYEMVAVPELVDADHWDDAVERTPPAPPCDGKGIGQTRLEQSEHSVADRGVEVATHQGGAVIWDCFQILGQLSHLIPPLLAIVAIYFPAFRVPQIESDRAGKQANANEFYCCALHGHAVVDEISAECTRDIDLLERRLGHHRCVGPPTIILARSEKFLSENLQVEMTGSFLNQEDIWVEPQRFTGGVGVASTVEGDHAECAGRLGSGHIAAEQGTWGIEECSQKHHPQRQHPPTNPGR